MSQTTEDIKKEWMAYRISPMNKKFTLEELFVKIDINVLSIITDRTG